jgi:hypothetical protein
MCLEPMYISGRGSKHVFSEEKIYSETVNYSPDRQILFYHQFKSITIIKKATFEIFTVTVLSRPHNKICLRYLSHNPSV